MNLVYDNFLKGKKAQWLCNANLVHSMGYVPDLAQGTAMLGNTPEAFHQVWNLPTDPQKITGAEWINLFASEMGVKNNYTVLPNWLIKSFGFFNPVLKEVAEMNYQYDRDYYFDISKYNDYFNFTPTSNALTFR